MQGITRLQWSQLSQAEQQQSLLRPAMQDDQALKGKVQQIITQVQQQGDQALLQLAQQFDRVELPCLRLSAAQLTELAAQTPAAIGVVVQSCSNTVIHTVWLLGRCS